MVQAQQTTITVTGTVLNGTDGSPATNPPGAGNVFGGGMSLTGKPFTLTYQFSASEGTYSSFQCPDGSIYNSQIKGSGTSSGGPTATLNIGGGSFIFGAGGYPSNSYFWNVLRTARESCQDIGSLIEINLNTYGPGSSGTLVGANLYAVGNFPSGDVYTSVPMQSLTPEDAFRFQIVVYQGTTLLKEAVGTLIAQSIAVSGPPPLPPAPIILDPVPQLLKGAQITNDITLLSSGGRPVKGIAADGVAQVVFRVPTLAAGDQVTATLLNCTDPATPSTCAKSTLPSEDGSLLAAGDPSDKTLAFRFVAYQSPIDFVRPTHAMADSALASRVIYAQFTYPAGQVQIVPLTIIRSPVMLIHGYAVDGSSWKDFTPLANDTTTFSVTNVNYGIPLAVSSTDPPIPSSCATTPADCVKTILQSDLGFRYNAPFVGGKIIEALSNFRMGTNATGQLVAAVQVDVVAHSMGGLIARQLTINPDYIADANFAAGYIHKLITIGTPHWGTPFATLILFPQASCTRDNAYKRRQRIVLSSAALSKTQQNAPGAVLELSGDGIGLNMSQALQQLAASSKPIPTVELAGSISGLGLRAYARLAYGVCPSTDPVASRDFDSASFATLFDPSITSTNSVGSGFGRPSDGVVPLTSALRNNHPPFTCVGPMCFPDYAHGMGTADLVGVSTYLVDNTGMVANEVENLLNTTVSNSSIWKVQ